ncbi:tetratricopeptide repeat protein [Actinoplanes sp. HUAS TT8]|uniref:tetratricopeptide repeat protein n=1 Tax=Actinoplanes sp. HUAS TT8 TaxID=3447453 RepID=UPI003F52851B
MGLLCGLAFALAGNLATNTVAPPDSWTWWPAVVWAVVVLLIAVSVWVQIVQSRPARPAGPDDQVLADLAARLNGDWSDEAARLDVTRPAPLRVAWSSTGRPGLAASRQAVLDDPLGGDWQQYPLHGHVGTPIDGINQDIVTAFRALPRRQLVVLGAPGAGKSVFAMLMTLGLIRDRVDEPLPVLLAINVWDPGEPVEAFLARRVADEYADVLAPYGDPRQVAERLVGHRRLLPVLDGLDELPDRSIEPALKTLDRYAAAGRALVVTCRIREYEQTVARSETILATAAVVELTPVGVDAVMDYLSFPERARPRWEPVFAHLREQADSPLAQTLASPLMAALARTAYQDPATRPAELLDFSSRQEVVGRLMDAFVTAVYSSWAAADRTTYPAGKARRWLTCLAYHLDQSGTLDLHWWQIRPDLLAVRRRWVRAMTVSVAILGAALIGGFAGGIRTAAAGAIIMMVAAGGLLRPLFPYGLPPFIRTTFRSRRRRRVERVALSVSYSLGGAVLAGSITGEMGSAILGGLAFMLVTLVVPAWKPGAPSRRTTRVELVHNRRTVGISFVQQAVGSGVVFTLAAWAAGVPPAPIGITAGLIFGTTAGLTTGGWAWIRFRVGHVRLALGGRLPWRLESFLADAHRHGLLRQAGTVYQFRHVLLQRYLSRTFQPRYLRDRAATAASELADLGRIEEAIDLLAGLGGWPAAIERADLLREKGRVDQAVGVLKVWSKRKVGAVTYRLADLLAEQGHLEEAIEVLQTQADSGDRGAAHRLIDLLADFGRISDLRDLTEAGDGYAAVRLVDLLLRQGSLDEAIQILRARASDGDRTVAEPLVRALLRKGCTDDAIQLLQTWNDRGPYTFVHQELIRLLTAHDRIDELRDLANSGDRAASSSLSKLLAKRNQVDELRVWAEGGSTAAADRLAELLVKQGRFDEAVRLLEANIMSGSHSAGDTLVDVLVGAGQVDEAIQLMMGELLVGRSISLEKLVGLLLSRDLVDEAIRVLRRQVKVGSWGAATLLADILLGQGRIEDALGVLRVRADAGESTAAEKLVELLTEYGRMDELRARADIGDRTAAAALARLLAARGSFAELRYRADAGDRAAARELARRPPEP